MTTQYLGITIDYAKNDSLTTLSKTLLTEKYCRDGEDIQEAFARACVAYATDTEHAQRMYNYVSDTWFMFASPVLSNAPLAGETPKALPISCFLTHIGDSLESLIGASAEMKWLAVRGGGIGGHWSDIRSVSAKSGGVVPFMKTIEGDMGAYRQGQTRRGSYAAYLDISHPDIEEFIQLRSPTGGDSQRKCLGIGFHHAVNIPDAFMEAVESDSDWDLIDPHSKAVVDSVRARELYERILEMRYKTGEPYLNFIDTAQKALNPWQRKKGLKLSGSNLCVAPETLILTDEGYQTIADLENQPVNVWNGEEFSPTVVRKTGEDQELITVTLSNGATIDCTPQHKFWIKPSYHAKEVCVEAQNLQPSDKLIKTEFPVIDHPSDKPALTNPYHQGFFSGDGCSTDKFDVTYFYNDKRSILEEMVSEDLLIPSKINRNSGGERHIVKTPKGMLKGKGFVPLSESLDSRLAWFAGLCDSDGCLTNNGGTQSIQIGSVNIDFLNETRMMLSTLGIDSKVRFAVEAGDRMMPDGKGGMELYSCNEAHRLMFGEAGVQKLIELGFLDYAKRVRPSKRNPNRNAKQYVTVESVVWNGRIDDTYCFTEPKRNMGVFNGILTGNCNEIHLVTDEERTAVCCLSSINAEKFQEWSSYAPQFIGDLIEFLDNVLQKFIDWTDGVEGFEKARYSAMKERSLGLGVLGLHSLYQREGFAFGSEGAADINSGIFLLIKTYASLKTEELAKTRGEPDDLKRSGTRNAHLMAVAPNANSGLIAGASPSIEPWTANAFTVETRVGSHLVKNKYLEEVLEDLGKNTDKVWTSIIAKEGSVQHLDFLTDEQKDIFKTAMEIDQMDVIKQAGVRQKYICQGQSVNVFFPRNSSKAELANVHYQAWKNGLKGLYYLRTQAEKKNNDISGKKQRVALKDFETPSQDDGSCEACEG